jgi:hypothetical protein
MLKMRELQALVTRRQQIVVMVTMEKNHLHRCETWMRQSIEAVIAQVEAQLVELEGW